MSTANPTVPAPQRPGPSGDRNIAAPPSSLNADQQSIWSIMEQTFEVFGFSGSELSQLMSWAKGQIISGNSQTQIGLDFYQTPWFKSRFAGIEMRIKNGLPPITPAAYLETEDQYTQILRNAGLPRNFYDSPTDFANWIGGDVSPSEVQNRIDNAYSVINTAPSEVQQAFSSLYGANGANALATYMLDMNRAEPILLKQVQAAQVAGAGAQFGFGLDRTTAEKLAAQGVDYGSAQTGFKQASMYQSLIHGGVNEQAPLGEQGVVSGEFGMTPGAVFALQQGVAGKQAAFAGSGAALETNTGITGLGKAQSI